MIALDWLAFGPLLLFIAASFVVTLIMLRMRLRVNAIDKTVNGDEDTPPMVALLNDMRTEQGRVATELSDRNGTNDHKMDDILAEQGRVADELIDRKNVYDSKMDEITTEQGRVADELADSKHLADTSQQDTPTLPEEE